MRKIEIVFIIILLGQNIEATSTSKLNYEIEEVFQHIDFEKIIEITREYFENDMSVQKLLMFVLNDEKLHQAILRISTLPEIDDILEWMKSNSVDIKVEVSNLIAKVQKATKNRVKRISSDYQTFSVATFGKEISDVINFERINELLDIMLENENDLAHLYLILKMNRSVIEKAFDDDMIVAAMDELKSHDFDTVKLKEKTYQLLRWT